MQQFEWDSDKAARNLVKHGISFEIAVRVFADTFALTLQDRIVDGERRWQTMGLVGGFLVILVAHTVIESDDGSELIRVISARKAEPKERKRYENRSARN